MSLKGFSIIVCCYNSANVIEDTLRHLSALRVPEGYGCEVILVNNLSTDNTVPLALDIWDTVRPPLSLQVVEENTPGLSFARNKGIQSSRYNYLLFCDDDNRLDPNYLLVAADVLEHHPEVGALGGLGIPEYEEVPAYWAEDFYIYGSGPQANVSGKVFYVHGAGVVIRREAFQKMEKANFKFLLSDRKGNQLSSGGDYELCYAIGLTGYIVWYEKRLTFRHFITSERLTPEYTSRFVRESAPAIDILDVYRYYLQQDNPLRVNFYFRQLKLFAYHGYRIYSAYVVRSKFRHDPKIVFLENFHIHFHKARMKCMLASFFKYRRWARQVGAFKNNLRLQQEYELQREEAGTR